MTDSVQVWIVRSIPHAFFRSTTLEMMFLSIARTCKRSAYVHMFKSTLFQMLWATETYPGLEEFCF